MHVYARGYGITRISLYTDSGWANKTKYESLPRTPETNTAEPNNAFLIGVHI